MGATTSTTAITNIYNLIILDESGSMSSIYEQALGGANQDAVDVAKRMNIDNICLPEVFRRYIRY